MSARQSLTTRLISIQMAVLVTAVGAGLGWIAHHPGTGSREVMRQALLAAGAAAAAMPASDRSAPVAGPAPPDRSPPDASLIAVLRQVRSSSGAEFVALVNRHGVVLAEVGSHPSSASALDAAAWQPDGRWTGAVRIAGGGTADAGGFAIRLTGSSTSSTVVVGLPAPSGSAKLMPELLLVFEGLLISLAVGVAGSIMVARWLRRQTFGLELDELTNLIQQQEATFHGIRDAVIGLDSDGRLQFANQEGMRLLRLPSRFLRRPASVLVPTGRLQDALLGRVEGRDLVIVHEDHVLILNRRPVVVSDRLLGYVVTIADRTESETLLRELDGMLGLTEALRAQAHDFSNRMHTIVGLIELGATAEAMAFATGLTASDTELAARLSAEVCHPMIVALLLAKSAVAAERGVALRLAPSAPIAPDVPVPSDLLTVIGNLVDNAIEATVGRDPAWVEVQLTHDNANLCIRVGDSGPGVADESAEMIFVDGYTTKTASGVGRRGLGLALVRQLVQRRGGTVSVSRDVGAVFEVHLPASAPTSPEPGRSAASRADAAAAAAAAAMAGLP